MEGQEKLHVGQDSDSVTALGESKSSDTQSQVVAASLHTKHKEDNEMSDRVCSTAPTVSSERRVDHGSSKISLAQQQSIPSAVSAFSCTAPPTATCGLEASSPLQPAPSSSCTVLPPTATCTVSADTASLDLFPHKSNPQTGESSGGQPTPSPAAPPSCPLPSSIATSSDGHAQHIDPTAVTVVSPSLPNVPSAIESGLLASDQGEKPLKKEKIRKRPRQLLQDARARDEKKSSEKHPVIRWKDVWVAQLIHIRGRMHSTFTSPQRQRVDLWQIVKHEMANSCYGFDKDSEACRKKWIRVYKEYKDDLHLSSDEKSQKCRFYDLVDFYMGKRASGLSGMAMPIMPICRELVPTAMVPTAMVPPPAHEGDVKVEDGGVTTVPHANSDVCATKHLAISKKPPLAKRPRIMIEKLPPLEKQPPLLEAAASRKPDMKSSVQTMLSELVNIGKELLQTTREFEKEKLAVLHTIKDTLGKIAKKI